jgi:hypothetical protein
VAVSTTEGIEENVETSSAAAQAMGMKGVKKRKKQGDEERRKR